jgi:hypothetical protein
MLPRRRFRLSMLCVEDVEGVEEGADDDDDDVLSGLSSEVEEVVCVWVGVGVGWT